MADRHGLSRSTRYRLGKRRATPTTRAAFKSDAPWRVMRHSDGRDATTPDLIFEGPGGRAHRARLGAL